MKKKGWICLGLGLLLLCIGIVVTVVYYSTPRIANPIANPMQTGLYRIFTLAVAGLLGAGVLLLVLGRKEKKDR